MRLTHLLALTSSLPLTLSQTWAATPYYDPTSGITFSSSTLPNGVTYRIALPANVSAPGPGDAIIQIVAPASYGWCGLAWGGRMTGNPLTVAWASGESGVVSSRWASAYRPPTSYPNATYTPLALSPSFANASHWSVTARCQGCTRWGSTDVGGKDSTTLAYACSGTKPVEPGSNSSALAVHDSPGRWDFRLAYGRNESFGGWVGEGV